jgi:hypothetical protein
MINVIWSTFAIAWAQIQVDIFPADRQYGQGGFTKESHSQLKLTFTKSRQFPEPLSIYQCVCVCVCVRVCVCMCGCVCVRVGISTYVVYTVECSALRMCVWEVWECSMCVGVIVNTCECVLTIMQDWWVYQPVCVCILCIWSYELCAEVTADVCCVCVHVFGHSDLHQAQSNKLQV